MYEKNENNIENINIENINNIETMRSATVCQYQNPSWLQQTPKPKIFMGNRYWLKFGATGLCHRDHPYYNDVFAMLRKELSENQSGWMAKEIMNLIHKRTGVKYHEVHIYRLFHR